MNLPSNWLKNLLIREKLRQQGTRHLLPSFPSYIIPISFLEKKTRLCVLDKGRNQIWLGRGKDHICRFLITQNARTST